MQRITSPRLFQSVVAALICVTSISSKAEEVIVCDGEFLVDDWEAIVLQADGGASGSYTQELTGGDPDSFRRIVHNVPGGGNFLVVFHRFDAFIYTPSVDGPISTIDYSESRRNLSGMGEVTSALALQQDGVVYVSFLQNLSADQNWSTGELFDITSADFGNYVFNNLVGQNSPDFSATGGEIKFGFARGNSSLSSGYIRTNGIDNWSLTIHRENPLVLGDVNLDGEVNLLDIAPFVELLAVGNFQAEADINQDGVVNLLDVVPFVDLLSGG